jgi:hypothetical protein
MKPQAHRCMVTGCQEWYSFGYLFGKHKVCGGHRKQYEADAAALVLQPAQDIPAAQGRLL